MSPEAWVVIGTVSGAVIGGLISVVIQIINQRYESKRKKKETIVNAGIHAWAVTMDKFAHKRYIAPMELYVAHMVTLVDILMEDDFDREKFKRALREDRKFYNECAAIIHEGNPRS